MTTSSQQSKRLCLSGLGLALAALSITSACADEALPPRPDERATLSFVLENDKFAGTDRNYTNGFRLSWLTGTDRPDGFSRRLANRVFGASGNALVRHGFAFGQSIFTPENIKEFNPVPDQHPYAGWLYGEYNLLIQQRDVVDRLSIQAGIVGPSAGGEWVQDNVHKLVGANEANGWDNQLPDELGVVLAYDRKMRSRFNVGVGRLRADVTPSFGVAVGNIYTNVRAGIMGRLGQDLLNDFGPPRVRPSLAGAGFFNPRDKASWYVFAGIEARAVAHNIFLDGSLFNDDSPTVDSKPLVLDFQVGGVAQFRRYQLSLTLVQRSDEFERQKAPQRFGALGIQTRF